MIFKATLSCFSSFCITLILNSYFLIDMVHDQLAWCGGHVTSTYLNRTATAFLKAVCVCEQWGCQSTNGSQKLLSNCHFMVKKK